MAYCTGTGKSNRMFKNMTVAEIKLEGEKGDIVSLQDQTLEGE